MAATGNPSGDSWEEESFLDREIEELMVAGLAALSTTESLNPLLTRSVAAVIALATDYFLLDAHTALHPEGI